MKVQNLSNNTSFSALLYVNTTEKIFSQEQLGILAQKAKKIGTDTDFIKVDIGAFPGVRFINELRGIRICTSINNQVNEFKKFGIELSQNYLAIMGAKQSRENSQIFSDLDFEKQKLSELPFFNVLGSFFDNLAEKHSRN